MSINFLSIISCHRQVFNQREKGGYTGFGLVFPPFRVLALLIRIEEFRMLHI